MSEASASADTLAELDRLVAGNNYPPEALADMAGPYAEYVRARTELRALDLGEVAGVFTFLPGGTA